MAMVAGSGGTAWAQPDKITEQARQKFLEGVAAYDAKNYEEARELFLQAYALKRHPAVLLNLGQSEIRAGYTEDGGNHLQQFLREFAQATAEQKTAAREGISEARKKTGYAILIVDTDGTLLAIDGQPIGQSPLADPVFVKPAEHEIEAKNGGKTLRLKFTAKQGTATPVQISMEHGTVDTSPTPPPALPVPPPSPSGDWGHDMPPPGSGPFLNPGYPNLPPPVTPPQPDTVPTGGRQSFGSWVKHKPGSWVLLGLTGLGLVGTIGFGAAAGSANSAANGVTNEILAQVARPTHADGTAAPEGVLPKSYYDSNGQPVPCGGKDGNPPAHPYYKSACDQLVSNLKAKDVDIGMMATSIVVMVLAGGGTALYYYLDTNPKKTATEPPRAFITVAPILNAREQGLGLLGTF